jgi:flagellar motor switch protein FliG
MAEEKMAKEFSGPEKAAIFLMSLGEEAAAKVLANFDENEIKYIGNYMSSMSEIEVEAMDEVRKEFYEKINSGTGGLGFGGLEFLKATLMKALDPVKAAEIINNLASSTDDLEGGLETVRMLDAKTISNFVVKEHPQTAAIILAHLESAVAGAVVKELPEDTRTEIMHRLAKLERVSPSVIRELDYALQNELRSSTAVSGSKMGGVEHAAKIMGVLEKKSENLILSELDESDPELAKEIRDLRFTFEDIATIDDQGLQLILKEIKQEDLVIALKTASDNLKEKIFTNMSERASLMLKEDAEALGPKKLSEVEASQSKVVAVCKKLEEEGKIQTGGADEEYV